MSRPAPTVAAAALLFLGAALIVPATASADPDPTPSEPIPAGESAPEPELYNVTYRARIDGVARGALITYKLNDTQVQSADPTMLPGRTFEAQTVLSDADLAGMQISIQWPYSANLHCEILVDDAIVAMADEFIKPRLTPVDDEPDYGKLMCGAPLVNPVDLPPVDLPPIDEVPGEPAPEPPVEPAA
ncbi:MULTISPECIES: hypothetical protein [Mycolicibacterium]|uniref:Secreted protein n=1 Tax=Mycolicibacterium chitae TaxID=1792 RepID=A0A3S4RGH9_MYCCI|nr:hypothetical protein [Mycolicibacterium chitae]MCV7106483.1 hypothetical protein [Mycolicibacterium chitae]VEG47762.1 Uncharacterised protein [Mycolicibacterium chitae]